MKSINRIFIFFITIMLLVSCAIAASDKNIKTNDSVIDKTKEKAVVIPSASSELNGKIKVSGGDASYKIDKPSKSEIKISKAENKNSHTKAVVTIPLVEIQKIDTDNDGQIGYLRFVDGQLVEKKIVSVASVASGSDTIWNMEFSDVVLNGWTGYFTKTGTSQLVSSTFTTSQTYASNKTSAVLLNVSAPAYVGPYAKIAALTPSAWYRFDNTSGTSAIDFSGHGQTATLINGTTWTIGKYNRAVKLDGIDDYVSIPSSSYTNFYPSGGSVITWARLPSSQSSRATSNIIAKYIGGTPGAGYRLYVDNEGIIKFEHRATSGTGAGYLTISGSTATDNKYHMYTVVVNNSSHTGTMWVDGVQVGTDTWTGDLINRAAIASVSSSSPSSVITGDVSDVVYTQLVLNQSMITSLYFDDLQQLQAKTNANATWSPMWNSSANNPIILPKKSTDGLINSLSFKVPVNMTDSAGVTTYYYNQTVGSFTPTTTIMFTEDITKIFETSTEPYQNISVVQTMLHNATNGNILLDVVSHIWNGSKTFTTNNSNASMTLNATKYKISTGYAKKNKSFSYVISMPYYASPLSVLNSTPSTGNVTLYNGTNQTFYIQTPYVETIKWYVNGVLKQTTAHSPSSYLWNITPNDQFNITAIATRQDGSISRTWNVSTPFNGSFVNPTAIVVVIVGASFIGGSFINAWYRRRKNN